MKRNHFSRLAAALMAAILMMMGSHSYVHATNIYEKGDVDGDGVISVEDACLILQTYARQAAGLDAELTTMQFAALDVNEDGVASVEDAVYVLQYYAMEAAGLQPEWSDLLPSDEPETQAELSAADAVLDCVNQERAEYGLSALNTSTVLHRVADLRAEEISETFQHTRPDGSSTFTVLQEYNISCRTAGENLAMGYDDPEDVVEAWMNSSSHRANILNSKFTSAGVGIYYSPDSDLYYWTLFFIG